MNFLFATDLHGDTRKYDRVLAVAKELKVDLVINGGDMLPKDGDLFKQDEFIREYLEGHFAEYEKNGIWYLCYLGNDDLRIFDQLFDRICGQFAHIVNLAQKKVAIKGYEFIGMNWVVDYPFRCKDRCRKDTADYQFQRQFGKGVLSARDGWEEIDDWQAYASELPTIEAELMQLPRPASMSKAVYVIHMPPHGVGLDMIRSGECVGSTAVREFIKNQQPLLSLHGHIHESRFMTNVSKAQIGKTISIQPGQHLEGLTYVIGDLDAMTFERREETFIEDMAL